MSSQNERAYLAELVNTAEAALSAATAYSDKIGEGFYWSPAYGMGGFYRPVVMAMTKDEALALLASGNELTENQRERIVTAIENDFSESTWESLNTGWNSSSSDC